MSRIKIFLSGLFIGLSLLVMPVVMQAAYYDGISEYEHPQYASDNILIYPPYEVPDRPTTYITTAPLNLRPTPCTSGTRIKLVPAGRRVEVTDFRDGEWFAVEINGEYGYMYAKYLAQMPESGLNATPGTVELIDWSVVRNIIPQNTAVTIIDVRTRTSIQMVSFSHGNHADVYPLTYADTEALRTVFGGWTWTPRPILVIVGDRTFAASMNGMPHGGGGRSGNNMNGHVCIHFRGSRTHNGSWHHERDHQNSILEAYRADF